MLSRLIRQRRRILAFTVCVLLALALRHGPGLAPVVAGGGAMLFAMIVIALLPSQRRWIEASAIGLVIAAPLPLSDQLAVPAALVAMVLVHALLYGQLSRSMGLRLGLDRTRKSRVSKSAADVWKALIPGECHPEDHWTGTLVDFDKDPDDPDTLYLRYQGAGGLHDEVTLTFVERVPHRHCRYFVERCDGTDAEEAIMTIALTDLSPGACRVQSRLQHETLPLRTALGRWFDDAFGDELDSLASTLHNRSAPPLREALGLPPPMMVERRAAS
jgi:hypothetical protein